MLINIIKHFMNLVLLLIKIKVRKLYNAIQRKEAHTQQPTQES